MLTPICSTTGATRKSASRRSIPGRKATLPSKKDGAYVLIPSEKRGAADQPSDFHAKAKVRAGPLDIEPSWNFKCDAGANLAWAPISAANANHSKTQKILRGAHEFGVGFSLVKSAWALGCSAMAGTSRKILFASAPTDHSCSVGAMEVLCRPCY